MNSKIPFFKVFRFLKVLSMNTRQRGPERPLMNSKGSALVMASIFMMVAVVLITIGLKLATSANKQTSADSLYVGEAENVARAGLVDALGWLRRNSGTTPVKAVVGNLAPGATPTYAINPNTGTTFVYADQPFNPQSSTSNAAKNDTMDPTIGLVNEYSVDYGGNSLDANAVLFGRYEVRQQPNPYPTPIASPYTPVAVAVHDISGNRIPKQANGNGIIWSVSSTGYIYKRVNKTFAAPGATPSPGVYYFPGAWNLPYNAYPNKVVATAKVSTEFRKLTVSLPVNPLSSSTTLYSAVYTDKKTSIVFPSGNNYARLNGAVSATSLAEVFLNQTGACPVSGTNATTVMLQGPSTCFSAASSELADVNIFGMSLGDVENISDFRGDPVNNPLNITQEWALSYFQGSVTYGGNSTVAPYLQLNTNGILVVNGNLTLLGAPSSSTTILASHFGGILFVTGNLTVQDGSMVEGCVIMGKPYYNGASAPSTLTLDGSPGNLGEVFLNPGLVNTALQLVATYREDVTSRKTLLAIPGFQ